MHCLVDLILAEVGGSGDGDLLLLAGAEVLCGYVYDAVRVDVEGNLDLRDRAIPAALARLDELIEPYGFSVSQMLSASFTVPSVSDVDAKIADMVNLLLKGAAFSTTVIGTVYQNVLSFFFTVMFTIYFLSSKERLRSQVKNLMRAYLKPRWVEKALSVADLSQRTFSSFITGQCLEACILGGMFFVTMTLLGMPYVLLISVFIAVTALIPVIGAWMGCIVGALLILVNDPLQALGFVALFLVCLLYTSRCV